MGLGWGASRGRDGALVSRSSCSSHLGNSSWHSSSLTFRKCMFRYLWFPQPFHNDATIWFKFYNKCFFPFNCQGQTFLIGDYLVKCKLGRSAKDIAHAKLKIFLTLLGNISVQLWVLGAGMALGHPVQAMLIQQNKTGGQRRSSNLMGQARAEA